MGCPFTANYDTKIIIVKNSFAFSFANLFSLGILLCGIVGAQDAFAGAADYVYTPQSNMVSGKLISSTAQPRHKSEIPQKLPVSD